MATPDFGSSADMSARVPITPETRLAFDNAITGLGRYATRTGVRSINLDFGPGVYHDGADYLSVYSGQTTEPPEGGLDVVRNSFVTVDGSIGGEAFQMSTDDDGNSVPEDRARDIMRFAHDLTGGIDDGQAHWVRSAVDQARRNDPDFVDFAVDDLFAGAPPEDVATYIAHQMSGKNYDNGMRIDSKWATKPNAAARAEWRLHDVPLHATNIFEGRAAHHGYEVKLGEDDGAPHTEQLTFTRLPLPRGQMHNNPDHAMTDPKAHFFTGMVHKVTGDGFVERPYEYREME